MTCIHPKIAFLDLIGREELPADFVWDIERWRTRSGVVKINVAMSELPDFIADPGKELQDHHTGSVELCFTPQYAEEAFQDSHMGRKASVRPFVDGVIPTTLDKKLAPEGVHVFSMFTQWCPTTGTSSRTATSSSSTRTGSSICTPSWRRTSRRR